MANELELFDLKLTTPGSQTAIAYRQESADWQTVDLADENRDLSTVTQIENLIQAILNRLYTRKGELAGLGHPDYGSRLYLLVGELNNLKTQALANLYIRECLQQEPRIEEIVEIIFAPPTRLKEPNTLKATLILKVQDLDTPIRLNLSLFTS